jgi:hypothetical protein
MWTGVIWLRTEYNGELLWTQFWTFGFHKRRGISCLAERLLASQLRSLYSTLSFSIAFFLYQFFPLISSFALVQLCCPPCSCTVGCLPCKQRCSVISSVSGLSLITTAACWLADWLSTPTSALIALSPARNVDKCQHPQNMMKFRINIRHLSCNENYHRTILPYIIV